MTAPNLAPPPDSIFTDFRYDPETGILWRLRTLGSNKPGPITFVTRFGYVTLFYKRRSYFVHRLAWYFVHGCWPTLILDHINGDKTDNRIANLREADYRQNAWNRAGKSLGRKHEGLPKGVTYYPRWGRWGAFIRTNGKTRYLGAFDNPSDAAAAYAEAANQLFGEFARVA